ncbi:IS110 family RNA-guided transposase [Flexibacterium corallicola]|uniref:IS110 family transposase n=1 Tax=Flexibacterium corallicola TaxID=3037259 RepID=UPI00286F5230|nr:IS110 family transposase [Pseudovibrio sp. M1P-2-3]
MSEVTIGVDISKDHLDVYCLPDEQSKQFTNTAAGYRQLKSWLKGLPVARIIFEPTGSYHGAFELALSGSYPLSKVNPWQARRFAQAKGKRAKTDRIDARLLAQMGQDFQLEPDKPVDASLCHLKEIRVARQALVKEATQLENRLKTQRVNLVRKQTQQRLKLVRKQLEALNAETQKQIEQSPQRARAAKILHSIPGLGQVAVAALVIEMPELGQLSRKQAAALAGLPPMTRQSGRWRGAAFIQAGRKPVRDALYMPAVVASRYNPDLKAKYNQMRAAGKPPKIAIIALMRKLIELANALIKADRQWQPKTA